MVGSQVDIDTHRGHIEVPGKDIHNCNWGGMG